MHSLEFSHPRALPLSRYARVSSARLSFSQLHQPLERQMPLSWSFSGARVLRRQVRHPCLRTARTSARYSEELRADCLKSAPVQIADEQDAVRAWLKSMGVHQLRALLNPPEPGLPPRDRPALVEARSGLLPSLSGRRASSWSGQSHKHRKNNERRAVRSFLRSSLPDHPRRAARHDRNRDTRSRGSHQRDEASPAW